MEKIIIADPDLSYLTKLQIKFLQKLQNSYEINIISEESYLQEFLQSTQTAICLIIHEAWLKYDFNKHDFTNIVVLTENESKVDPTHIFRNTDSEEIFNWIRDIVGFSIASVSTSDITTVLFKSAKGGTGKTVLALALAHYFAAKHYNVLYVNTQTVQSFQYYLKNKAYITSEVVIGIQDSPTALNKYIKKDVFNYLPPFDLPLHSYGITKDIFIPFIKAAKDSNVYDYIIIDSDNELDIASIKQLSIADKILFITNPGEDNFYALSQLLKKININQEKTLVVCNMSSSPQPYTNEYITKYKNLNSENIEAFAKTTDIKRLAMTINGDIA